MSKKQANVKVFVTANVDKALRQLKKKIEREGIVRDMKRVVYFESPTQKKRKRNNMERQTLGNHPTAERLTKHHDHPVHLL